MTYLAILTLAIWAFGTGLTVFGTVLFLLHFRSRSALKAESSAPTLAPVSILKPLKGVDSGLRENLQSFFDLSYPKFEIVFCVADSRDPAAKLVSDLIEANPAVDACLIIGAVDIGPNPKVNNMLRGYKSAKYDLTLISDSNVRVPRNYLTELVPDLDDQTGVISGVVLGAEPKSFGAQMEATFLNSFCARWMILGSACGFPTVIGKSMLFRRSVAKRFGGIEKLAQFLAEDYMAGQAMLHLGLKIKHMRQPIPQIIGEYSFKNFWDRHVRWGRMRKMQNPLAYLGEPINGPTVSGLLGAFACAKLFGVPVALFFAAHLAFWFLNDALVMHALGSKLTLMSPVWWLIREATSLPHWAHSISGNTVLWRGSRLRLQPGGTLDLPQQREAVQGA